MASGGLLVDVSTSCEVDYNPVGSFWVAARVESATPTKLRLRFPCGLRDICHELSVEEAVASKKLCAAGMRSVPLLQGQPVDVLRRTGASAGLGPCEQWQQGQIINSTGRLTSFGGDRPVAVKVISAGEAVLGITYPPPPSPASSTSTSAGGDQLASPPRSRPVEQGAPGRAGESPGSEAGTPLAARPPAKSVGPLLPPGTGVSSLLLAEPSLLAPQQTFAVRVPTLAHVTSVTPGMPPTAVRSLPTRAKALLEPSAMTTARYHVQGRHGVYDYSLLDVLPPDGAGSAGSSTLGGGGGGGGGGGSSRGGKQDEGASTAHPHGGAGRKESAGSVSSTLGAGVSSAPGGVCNPNDGEGGALMHALRLHFGPSLGEVATDGVQRQEDDTTRVQPHAASLTLTSTRACAFYGDVLQSPGGDGAPLPGHMPARIAVRQWRLARVRFEQPDSSSSAGAGSASDFARAVSASSHGVSTAGVVDFATELSGKRAAGGGGGGAGKLATAGKAQPAALSGSPPGKDGARPAAPRAIVYWFEPLWVEEDAGGGAGGVGQPPAGGGASVLPLGRVVPMLRAAPLDEMLAVAAPGTHTIPHVPGQRMETRRMGGLWAPSVVLRASRGLLHVSVVRPPRANDSNASVPTARASFGANATALSVRRKRRKVGPRGEAGQTLDDAAGATVRRDVFSTAVQHVPFASPACTRPGVQPRPGSALASALHTLREGPALGSTPLDDTSLCAVEAIPQHLWQYLTASVGHYCAPEAWKAHDAYVRAERVHAATRGGQGSDGKDDEHGAAARGGVGVHASGQSSLPPASTAGRAAPTASAAHAVVVHLGSGGGVASCIAYVHEELQARQGALMRVLRPE